MIISFALWSLWDNTLLRAKILFHLLELPANFLVPTFTFSKHFFLGDPYNFSCLSFRLCILYALNRRLFITAFHTTSPSQPRALNFSGETPQTFHKLIYYTFSLLVRIPISESFFSIQELFFFNPL